MSSSRHRDDISHKAPSNLSSLQALPDDAIRFILSLLRHEERMSLQTVSQAFRFHILHTPIAEDSIHVYVHNNPVCKDLLTAPQIEGGYNHTYATLLSSLIKNKNRHEEIITEIKTGNKARHLSHDNDLPWMACGIIVLLLILAGGLISIVEGPPVRSTTLVSGIAALSIVLPIIFLAYHTFIIPLYNRCADKKVFSETIGSTLLFAKTRPECDTVYKREGSSVIAPHK